MNERGVITASILVPLGLIAGGVAGYWVYKRNKKRMHATISKRLKQKKEEDFDEDGTEMKRMGISRLLPAMDDSDDDLPNRVGGKRRTHRRRR